MSHPRVREARAILESLGFPRGQINDRSALCLLALLNLTPDKSSWAESEAPLIGITPIMEWVARHDGRKWAPNTRETVRRQTMHQFVDAGLAVPNPDRPDRPTNSPHWVYQVETNAIDLLRTYGTVAWNRTMRAYLAQRATLVARYAQERAMTQVPVRLSDGQNLELSPGEHSELIKAIVESFAPRFVPGATLVYVGDTGSKWGYLNQAVFDEVGVTINAHGKMPDVVLFDRARNWLLLAESVTSHGPVDGKRHAELARLFAGSSAGLVYITAFPNRATMARYLPDIAWESEVWVADAPTHLIHFNGTRFLGPYTPP